MGADFQCRSGAKDVKSFLIGHQALGCYEHAYGSGQTVMQQYGSVCHHPLNKTML